MGIRGEFERGTSGRIAPGGAVGVHTGFVSVKMGDEVAVYLRSGGSWEWRHKQEDCARAC